MQSRTLGLSSLLAVLGGVFFLALPIAFLNGTVSVIQPLASSSPPSYGYGHIIEVYRPMTLSTEMVAFLGVLGGLGILLGVLILVMRVKPRRYLTWSVPFSLGSESLLFWILSIYIQAEYVVSPAIYSVFLPLATVSMMGATLLLTFGLALSNYPRKIDADDSSRKGGMSSRREKNAIVQSLWFPLFGF